MRMNIVVVAEGMRTVWELECLRKLGVCCKVSTRVLDWKFADAIVLPAELKRSDVSGKALPFQILMDECQIPVLAIDNGMRILVDEEAGLGILPGKIRPLAQKHVGWGEVVPKKPGFLEGVDRFPAFFGHSHYSEPKDRKCVAAVTKCGETTFPSALAMGNIFAVQFRLDKSGIIGQQVLERFLQAVRR